MSTSEWNTWDDGVLNASQMAKLAEWGWIQEVNEKAIKESSIDIRPHGHAYLLPEGSVKPMGTPYIEMLKNDGLIEHANSQDQVWTLQPGSTYIFEVAERLEVSKLADHSVWGKATAKSSIGRMDVLARLIVDGMKTYEEFDPLNLKLSSGKMYLEVTPITFPIQVKADVPLAQMRLFKSEPRKSQLTNEEVEKGDYLVGTDSPRHLSVELSPEEIRADLSASAFRAKGKGRLGHLSLWDNNPKPDPCKYWDFVNPDKNKRLMIESGHFYILRSKERIQLPNDVAVYCRAIQESIGEIRIHYAGFVHPGFGKDREDGKKGTPLIFEVRGHGINANLADGEILADLEYYRMSQPASAKSKYNDQELNLSNFFEDWPEELEVDRREYSVMAKEGDA